MNNNAVQAIKVVQYTLDDFVKGKPQMDEVIRKRLIQNQKIMSEVQVALLNEDHFGEVNPVCPYCGSIKHVKDGFRVRHPKLGDFGGITVYVQRYECKRCGRGFSARIDSIVKKWHQYAEIYKERVCAAAAIMKGSLRAIQQLLLAWFGIRPSHEVIESWLYADIPEFLYSGYYTYDEQVVRIKGKRAFRLTLFDVVLNCTCSRRNILQIECKPG